MEDNARQNLIRGAFLRLMFNNICILIATCACGVIDNLFIGRILGKDSLAAVGFFSPVTTAVGLSYVLIMGMQVLAGNYIGEGKPELVNRLFVSVFSVLFVFSALFTAICIIAQIPLAGLLGAKDEVAHLLCDYIKGYAPGIIPQTLAALLMALCSFNNDLKRSYCGIAAMILGNILGDLLLVGPLGLLGIGLASSISSAASFLVLIPGFIRKDKLFHFDLSAGFSLGLVGTAALRGLPSLTFTFGVILKNSCFNYGLNLYTGSAGVAVAGIMATVCALVGAVPAGCGNAFSALAGLYYGEQDRESYLTLARTALKIGTFSTLLCTAVVMILSRPLAVLFVPGDPGLQPLCQRMFLLAFSFLLPNAIYNIFIQSYRAQGRMHFINVMSFAEVAMVGVFALIAMKWFGSDAAWLANTVVDVLCIGIVAVSVIVFRKKFDLSLPAWLKLSDDFGAAPGDVLEYSVRSLDNVIAASAEVVDFCKKKNYPGRVAYFVGLSIEEMAANVLKYGFGKDSDSHASGESARSAYHASGESARSAYHADIRVVSKEDGLTVRIRDNCREFDPRQRIDLYNPESPESHIGIRMVAKLANQIDYYNNAGINTTIMKF